MNARACRRLAACPCRFRFFLKRWMGVGSWDFQTRSEGPWACTSKISRNGIKFWFLFGAEIWDRRSKNRQKLVQYGHPSSSQTLLDPILPNFCIFFDRRFQISGPRLNQNLFPFEIFYSGMPKDPPKLVWKFQHPTPAHLFRKSRNPQGPATDRRRARASTHFGDFF